MKSFINPALYQYFRLLVVWWCEGYFIDPLLSPEQHSLQFKYSIVAEYCCWPCQSLYGHSIPCSNALSTLSSDAVSVSAVKPCVTIIVVAAVWWIKPNQTKPKGPIRARKDHKTRNDLGRGYLVVRKLLHGDIIMATSIVFIQFMVKGKKRVGIRSEVMTVISGDNSGKLSALRGWWVYHGGTRC